MAAAAAMMADSAFGSDGFAVTRETISWESLLVGSRGRDKEFWRCCEIKLLNPASPVPVIVVLRRLVRLEFLGRLLVMLALVVVMKLELATLRKGVGKARRILWEYGTAPAGSGSLCEPMLVI